MRKNKGQTRPIRIIIILVIVLPVIFYVLASTIGRKDFSLPHRLAIEMLGPVQTAFSKTLDLSSDIWHHYLALVQVSRENDQLRREIKHNKKINASFREAAAVNGRLQKLLDLEQSVKDPSITAQIIGRDPSIWFKTLTVNKGSSSGIAKGMPVINPEGVVGQVINVSPHYSKILAATDPNSAIDAIVQGNRTQGIIKGNGRGYQLLYISRENIVRLGAHIITSGMGGIFPKGLAIGQIAKVIKRRRGMFQKIRVKPAADFQRLEYLTIILHRKPMID
ncbi:MAG: rod shape-determining protein MreC [Deltaproteobacteria bacterium]|nr:rod shape-determining protein MreC [Deltaproteobacteria bacterium]